MEKVKRCGDCANFIPPAGHAGANEGYCNAFLDDEGTGNIVDIYTNAEKCKFYSFIEQSRIRTEITEFMYDINVRPQREFDEK